MTIDATETTSRQKERNSGIIIFEHIFCCF